MSDSQNPNTPPARDYRETVFLPQTDFPMRAGLPKAEPELLKGWEEADLYYAVRKVRQAAGAPLFVLHDGPPYANGNIHIGHALNKILKDFVVRSKFLTGHDVDYVPGWDCHGLPIEWKIEEEFRAKGRKKDEVPAAEFRKACREYAAKWVESQREEFKRLGVLGDWQNRYATMDYTTEAKVTAEFHKFLMSGQLYRGSKPVMWSPVERTALADAEIEYHTHVSPTVWVKFPIRVWHDPNTESAHGVDLNGASVVIWTTTPWTIPANRAISYSRQISYGVYQVDEIETALDFAPWAVVGEKLILADKLAEEVFKSAKILKWSRLAPAHIEGLRVNHPLYKLAPDPDDKKGYGFDVPMLAGDHVTDDAGTGFVHTAPGHGVDDYLVWLKSGRSLDTIPETVDADGAYYPHVPLFAGMKVLETEGKKAGKFGEANGAVMNKLIEAGNLLARGRVEHSYPHSWRSKAPVIFRNTPQWFIRMDGDDSLRDKAIAAIADTDFYPDQGRNRIGGMVETRPDWLISRQRNWGTPLAMYINKSTGEPLRDEGVNKRITDLITEGGADAWFTRPDTDFLGNTYDPDDYEKVTDILDVWFDSGCTHAFTIEGRANSHWPADLYLEGSDQHRGWFQSSLLESCGTRGRAPYKAVLTHGFVLDENGEKMSKSKGNTTAPQDIAKESGVEILRLWVAFADYSEDLRIGKQILQTTVDAYRKLRNTVRYLLGALHGYTSAEAVDYADMPSLERYILSEVYTLDAKVRQAYEAYDFAAVVRPVADFCIQTLSALYFDIRKDSLYCDQPSALKRRACRTVMHILFERLTLWLGPILTFTCEEAWASFSAAGGTASMPGANLFRVLEPAPEAWHNPAESDRWAKIESVLSVVTAALEDKRRDKTIGSALEAAPIVYIADASAYEAFEHIDAAEVFRTSQATLVSGSTPKGAYQLDGLPMIAVEFVRAEGQKCQRSWRILPEVGSDPRYPYLSLRDAEAVKSWDESHAG
ncbi:MAG: isoleucine--tRNA ligase [Asticcacaulis sp.]